MNLIQFFWDWQGRLGTALILAGIWSGAWLWLDTPLLAKFGQANKPLQYQAFAAQILDGQKGTVKGIYVQDVLALPVLPQPSAQPNFVHEQPQIATQYYYASAFGSLGIIAHNHLAGKYFFDLEIGQIVQVVYGDGLVERYLLQEIHYYRAINPHKDATDFIDLQTHEFASASSVFSAMYGKSGRLVLQTCIAQPGENSWGRLFLIGIPLDY